MARTRTKDVPPASNSFVASAAKAGLRSLKNLSRSSRADGWQIEGWKYYHSIGEYRYACDWVGNQLSKALIFASQVVDGKARRVAEGDAFDVIEQLFGDPDGRAEMFRLVGIHMTVAGECHILGYEDPDPMGDGGDVWHVIGATQLRQAPDGQYWINGQTLDVDPNKVVAFRIWRPDPIDPESAIAPTRALLSILGEIARLTDHVAAQVDSRLAGAGILLMPSEMTFPTPPSADGESARVANNAEDLMRLITEAMGASIDDRSDPSALVPIVITAPAEVIDKIQHLTFWSELDSHAIELRTEAIRRLALGMDMPPEVLQGAADANHWSAWQADESAIKAHTEPLLKLITGVITRQYLRPVLYGMGMDVEEVRTYGIMCDTSEMRLRPNRSKEALELYNLGALSREALIRETGFEVDDAMSDKERAEWLMQKVAGGSTTPEIVEAALREMGVTLNVIHDTQAPETIRESVDGPAPTEARPAPSLKDHPVQDIPDQKISADRKQARDEGRVPSADIARKAALIAASDMLVVRALERAGNKLKNQMTVKPTCAATDIYKFVQAVDTRSLLDDAWAHVPGIAERYGIDAEWLTANLHTYVKELLESQRAHNYEMFSAYLSAQMVLTLEGAA